MSKKHSYNKLEQFLNDNNLYINTIFVNDGFCSFIETYSPDNTEYLLIYISSQFYINPPVNTTGIKIYNIEYIDDDKLNNLLNDDNASYEDTIKLDFIEKDNIEENKLIQNNYNKQIKLNNKTIDLLNDIKKQLERFDNLVKNLSYKFAIWRNQYLAAIKKDDFIECYKILDYNNSTINNKLLITTDIKSFYQNINTINKDIFYIKQNIYKIISNNQSTNNMLLNDLFCFKDELITKTHHSQQIKQNFENTLAQLLKYYNIIIENINQLQYNKQQYIKYNDKSNYIYNDAKNSQHIYNIDTKINRNQILKQEIQVDIDNIRSEYESWLLDFEKVLFENSILLSNIIKNFKKIT